MAKQTFTVGQVLTAAQVTSLQQTAMLGGAAQAKTASYTLVAADAGTAISMTSTSATTVTVNTGLFAAGDTVFIQNLGSGNLTITAGTATVSTAGSLILPTNDAGVLYFVSTGVSIFYDFIQVGAASPLTTKGDLYTFSTSDARLAVGTDTFTLVADSAEATGLKWAAASGGMTLISTTSLSGTTTTISVSANSYKELLLVFRDAAQSNNTNLGIRINSISGGSDYINRLSGSTTGTAFNYSSANSFMPLNAPAVDGYGTNIINGSITFFDANSTKNKLMWGVIAGKGSSNTWGNIINSTSAVQDTAVISSIAVCSFDTFTLSGSALLYGVS